MGAQRKWIVGATESFSRWKQWKADERESLGCDEFVEMLDCRTSGLEGRRWSKKKSDELEQRLSQDQILHRERVVKLACWRLGLCWSGWSLTSGFQVTCQVTGMMGSWDSGIEWLRWLKVLEEEGINSLCLRGCSRTAGVLRGRSSAARLVGCCSEKSFALRRGLLVMEHHVHGKLSLHKRGGLKQCQGQQSKAL